jgi:hypothetical protein
MSRWLAMSRLVSSNQKVNNTMKNRSIILTTILSLLVCGGLSCMAQAGPPPANVNVVNTPNVNVANTPKVTVVNTTANPVPVTGTVGVTENAAHNAVQQDVGILAPGQASITIPADKIFVLETVSFSTLGVDFIELDFTGHFSLINGVQSTGTVRYFLQIPPNTFENAVASTASQNSQALRLYAQPGTTITIIFSAVPNFSGSPGGEVSLSGYLVSAQ